jgi:glutamate racemase
MAGQDRQDSCRYCLTLSLNASPTASLNRALSVSVKAPLKAPIGIFDSGVGGMSVLRAIHALLPQEALLYVADSRYAPYGERDDAYIVARCLAISEWLLDQGVKALVVACNTATAQTIQQLRAHLAERNIAVVGVEPAVKPAALVSKTRIAGVLATASTLRSARFQALLARHSGDCRFVCVAGNGLVDAIEQGDTGSPHVLALLEDYLGQILAAGADTLVLGCTHYPFLDQAIRHLAGERLTLIDSGTAIARQLQRVLEAQALLADTSTQAHVRLCSTGDPTALHRLTAALGIDAQVDSQPGEIEAPLTQLTMAPSAL